MAETSELMKRPNETDDVVKRRALEICMPSVQKYMGTDWKEEDRKDVESNIASVMGSDGYRMARDLENRYYWEPDRALVDLMDGVASALIKAEKEILNQWISVYGIAPERKVGDTVSTTHWRRKGQVGTITKIYLDEAKYGVHFPDQPITLAAILPYEEVIDAPMLVEEPV